MVSQLKNVGTWLFVAAIMLAALSVLCLFVFGVTWLSVKVMPILAYISGWAVIVSVVLLPFTLAQRTRKFSAYGFLIASFVFGLSCWVYSLLVTYSIWGVIGIVVGGLLTGGVVVPVAALAALLNGQWEYLGWIGLGVTLTYGTRVLALVTETYWLRHASGESLVPPGAIPASVLLGTPDEQNEKQPDQRAP